MIGEPSRSYPNGSLFLHNNGRAVHYNGPSLLQWRSIRMERSLNPGDRVTVTSSGGKVMFAINDFPMEQCFDDVIPDMFPVVHIQKKGVRIKASFGKKKISIPVTKELTPSASTTSKPGMSFNFDSANLIILRLIICPLMLKCKED
jgi:hypothetical protein